MPKNNLLHQCRLSVCKGKRFNLWPYGSVREIQHAGKRAACPNLRKHPQHRSVIANQIWPGPGHKLAHSCLTVSHNKLRPTCLGKFNYVTLVPRLIASYNRIFNFNNDLAFRSEQMSLGRTHLRFVVWLLL